ncbi:GGDEF domain-containing protein [Candidatus Weimeria sp. HCP3S3_B5]|uniref:GGDEF domain-containing protein n=1 Tax=Candidatus Weimeria sp. HCP3S3_B5 TaxID=3438871 RepID=UPI003F896D13
MIYNPLALYIEVNAVSVIMLLTILIKSIGSELINQWQYFVSGIALMVINITCDTIWQLMDSGCIPGNRTLDYITKSIYFFSLTFIGLIWLLLSEAIRRTAFSAWRLSMILSGAIVYLHALLLITNPWTGFLFHVGSDLFYVRGRLFILQYIFPFVYLAVCAVRSTQNISREKNYFERTTFFANSLCPLIPVAASLLQLYFRRLPLLAPSLAITIFLLYTYLIESGVKYDSLTGLSNRRALFHTISHWMKSPSESGLFLFMIDVDFFKTINDSFGHVQGDIALKEVAEILESGIAECGKRALAARYGGDEFTIILQSESSSENNRISARIQRLISMSNKSGDHIYNLSLSIGCVRYDPLTTHTVRELVNAADSVLYLVKKQRHIQRL